MKSWANICKVASYIWFVLAGLFIVTVIVTMWVKKGFVAVQDLLNPFNLANFIVTIIILSPGLGLLILSEKLKNKGQTVIRRNQNGTP